MKRFTLFFTILMAAGLAKAQNYTYDSIVNLDFGFYGYDIRNFLELRNGNILSFSPFYIFDDNGNYVGDLGDMLVKLSSNASFLDSTLMENDYANYCLLERNPQDDDNLYVRIAHDFEHQKTDLLIRRFDDQFNYDTASDIIVPLEDTVALIGEKYLLEDEGNLIVWYMVSLGPNLLPITPVMVRVGLDGTIKDRVELPDNIIGDMSIVLDNLMVYNDSPREYAWYQTELGDPEVFGYFVVDSLFQLKEYVRVEEEFEPGYMMNYSGEQVLFLDDDTYLVSSRYYKTPNMGDNGVRITKYNKTNHTNLGSVRFATKPHGPNSGFITCAIPRDLKKSAGGDLYYVYQTADLNAPSGYYVGVSKLDTELNVLWHRYCLNPGFDHCPNLLLSLENGGCVVGGYKQGVVTGHVSPKMFYLFFHEDGTSTQEAKAIIRPYLFYPNPAQDQLHLQYSPDVKPMQVELYDLQGRLVRTQSKELESISLQGLSAGTYTMRVMLEDGKAFSDKIVKE